MCLFCTQWHRAVYRAQSGPQCVIPCISLQVVEGNEHGRDFVAYTRSQSFYKCTGLAGRAALGVYGSESLWAMAAVSCSLWAVGNMQWVLFCLGSGWQCVIISWYIEKLILSKHVQAVHERIIINPRSCGFRRIQKIEHSKLLFPRQLGVNREDRPQLQQQLPTVCTLDKTVDMVSSQSFPMWQECDNLAAWAALPKASVIWQPLKPWVF